MSQAMTEEVKAFFQEPNFAHLAMLREDGSPQAAPVWVDLEGDRIVIATQKEAPKIKATRRDPRVALSVVRQSNPYSEAYVRGRVVEFRTEGAGERMNAISRKYIGEDFPFGVTNTVLMLIEVDAAKTRNIPFKEPAHHRS